MVHKSLSPAPYKLIPFDPVPYFLAIAGLAILVNLLVLLGVLVKSLEPELVGKVKKLIGAENKRRESRPLDSPQASGNGTYEVDVEAGALSKNARTARRYTTEDHVGTGAQTAEAGKAATQESTE